VNRALRRAMFLFCGDAVSLEQRAPGRSIHQ
jgi:hypothetical protein